MSQQPKRRFVCLYHRTDTHNNSVEDILQRAFGGTKTSSVLICGDCNNTLGNTIDKQLAESLEWITTFVNPVGRRKPPATLKNVLDENGDLWHIGPGGKPSVPYTSLGPNSWKADAKDIDIAMKNAEAKANAMGIDKPTINVERMSKQAGIVPFELMLENEVMFRSACKSALEALVLIGFDEDDRRSDLLLDARTFVMNGGNYRNVGLLTQSILDEAFTNLDHRILLVQSPDLSVYWEFILYGGIVAVSGRFAPIRQIIQSWMYQVCPKTGKKFEGPVQMPVVTNDFQSWSPVTTAAIQTRMAGFLSKLNYEPAKTFSFGTLVDECLDEIDNLGITDPLEYRRRASVLLVERLVPAIASATGKGHDEVLKFL
jgi:hypothetical protein